LDFFPIYGSTLSHSRQIAAQGAPSSKLDISRIAAEMSQPGKAKRHALMARRLAFREPI
jgi:hypothetical protein